jgi:TRAP-type C4-dicarboxylate transport system permease small subunit
MTKIDFQPVRPADPAGRVLYLLAYTFVLIGGAIMAAVTVMTVTSILGRWLFLSPIYGDFELAAIGTAISVFLFLPYCHLLRGNVVVDLFLAWAPERVQILFDAVGSAMLGVIGGVLAWRMALGGADMFRYGEVSIIVGFPIWIPFPFAVAAGALLALCCLYTTVRDVLRAVR